MARLFKTTSRCVYFLPSFMSILLWFSWNHRIKLNAVFCFYFIPIPPYPKQELWALFNFCCPGLLGDKQWYTKHVQIQSAYIKTPGLNNLKLLLFWRFKEKYEHLILRGNDKNAYDRDKRIGSAVAKVITNPIFYTLRVQVSSEFLFFLIVFFFVTFNNYTI